MRPTSLVLVLLSMVLAEPDKMPKIKAELEKQPFKGKLHDLQVDTQGVRVEEK